MKSPEVKIEQIETEVWLEKFLELDLALHAHDPSYHIDDSVESLREFMNGVLGCTNFGLFDETELVGYLTWLTVTPNSK